jgi:hypothetical protein
MTEARLAVSRLNVKRHAANVFSHHLAGMTTTRHKRPQSVLQELFMKRVREEMAGLSENELSKRPGGPRQKTLNDVLNGADPRLKTVHEIATALNRPAWTLFVESSDLRRAKPEAPVNVSQMPELPRMLGTESVTKSQRKSRDKKRASR